MYTRNFGKQKYNPPPGYDGTFFRGNVSTKHHEPTELIRAEETVPEIEQELLAEVSEQEDIVQNIAEETAILPEVKAEKRQEESQLGQILTSLRGKLGTEELIILMVMMLIAAEGFSAEMLILGVLLVV